MEHTYCKILLKEVMKEVKKKVSKTTIKNAWAYSFGRCKEFQIDRCPELPNGFYWSGRACCLWAAKAEGWQHFLDKN